MASLSSTQSTQPFSDVSQPGADLEQLISSLLRPRAPEFPSSQLDPTLVRIFARCYMYKRCISIVTFPDGTPATVLDHDILAVSQSTQSTGCDIEIPSLGEAIMGTHLRLHFDPSQDAITASNLSPDWTVTLQSTTSSAPSRQFLKSGEHLSLQPGAWTILTTPQAGVCSPSVGLLDLCIQPRNFWVSKLGVAPLAYTGSKRRQPQNSSSSKKQKAATGSRPVQTSAVSHPLLELQDGEQIRMTGQERNDNYQLARHKHLTSTRSARLFTADYSLRPGQVVLTKVLKPRDDARSTALAWMREVAVHDRVGQHPRIVSLFGFDARSFTLYMEYIDSPPLVHYRDKSNMCTCPTAAFTILSDLADALQHVHAAGVAHNDIKPGNIIYHKTRGAILIDFGLGGRATATSDSGTPWYLPPEYLHTNQRGPASDLFALGVTMLWVLQKCSLPDLMEEWQIRDIHQGPFERRVRAQKAMKAWLEQVEKFRSELPQSERSLESVVSCILVSVEKRENAENIAERLESVTL